MRRDLSIRSGNLAGTSDFRVVAKIKPGLIPSLDAMTYKTRVKRVLRTLHAGRAGGFEYEFARILSDAVERVGVIHSVGIAVLEPEDTVLLTVTFDGAWESYVRVIWQKVARLLDLIFCNTENYVNGYENSYEKWGEWLKTHQSEAYFLYATPALTVDDTRYLKTQERVQRREAGTAAEQRINHIRIPTAEDIARQSLFGKGGPIGTDPTNAGFGQPLIKQDAGAPPFRHGVKSLVGLYRLADVFLPGTPDGEILHRAARELLPEFGQMLNDGVYQAGIFRATKRFEEAVHWLLKPPPPEPAPRLGLPVQPPAVPPLQDAANVQGGILSAYADVDHGCLLLLNFEKPAAVAALLRVLPFTSEADPLRPGQIATNIAFTSEGLRAAGMSDDEMRQLPDEFVQGMERRAALLGDLRINHPRRWRLPALNWHLGENAPDIGEDDPSPRIDLSGVHAIVQVRLQAPNADMAKSRAQLMAAMRKLVTDNPGVKPLSLQWMQRLRTGGNVKEHFGFLDGTSNPVFKKEQAGVRYPNHVNLGEVLCGYPNLADKTPMFAGAPEFIRSLLQDGSFLAVRKLRQDVDALEQALSAAQKEAAAAGLALTREDFMAKMMGRWPSGHPKAGQPLAVVPNPGPESNDFHFESDKDAALCPFHAHIRRANPRVRNPEAGSRPPRFMRRGMSYGAPRPRDSNGAYASEAPATERGLIFMAYNANLGEQYELVQSWLNGGNSSGSFSGESDPIFGIAEPGRRRYFRFEQDGKTVRMGLDGSDRLHEEPRPFVRLEWGAYLFAPSKKALASLQARAAAQSYQRAVPWSADVGEKEIARLREFEAHASTADAIEAWKTTLEDPVAASDFTTASVWAAIRERHGGVLKTPFGVLVAERSLVEQVLQDPSGNLSATGYLPRMHDSFGEIYLGLDDRPGATYQQDSAACNDAIMKLDLQATFQQAKKSTRAALQELVNEAKGYAQQDGDTAWDLTVDARELIDPMLAKFCEEWFGLSEQGGFFRRGSFRWDWQPGQPPLYPGHFLAPSRYFFQPQPGETAADLGKKHGVAARAAMLALLSGPGAATKAPVARAVLNSVPGKNLDFAARTIIGAAIGFVPTVSGNLLQILNEWLREGTLWALRARYGDSEAADDFTDACSRLGDAFIPALQLRPVPPTIWRTAVAPHTLGAGVHQVDVNPGEKVVVGAISATQQSLQQGGSDYHHAFGGNRKANPHPTHACPGKDPALAVMIGFFSALVESELPLRAGPGPLTIALDGRLPAPDEAFKEKIRSTISIDPAYDEKFEVVSKLRPAATATPLLMVGDSWLFDQWDRDFGVTRPNLTKSLRALGYTDIASSTTDFAYAGRTLSQMADEFFLRDVTNFIADQPDFKALILGGGGNDVVSGSPGRQPLFKMLRPRSDGPPALDEAEVTSFIDGTLFGHYNTILTALTASTSAPIILHAYDHPIPDGRGDNIHGFEIGPWLYPYFVNYGYKIPPFPTGSPDLELAKGVMKELINRLNTMVTRVAAAYPTVHHVNLTGTLAKAYGTDYASLWNNELHPKGDGYDLLAKLIETELINHGVLGNPTILASK
jgi:Dyp-type peroxidase family